LENAKQKSALWTRDFVLLALANLCLFFSFQMLIPTLPAFVTDMGGDELQVGMVISVFTISAVLTRPFAGRSLDTAGRRKTLLTGLTIFILSVAGYYWLALVTLVLALRFIHGIGWGIVSTAFGTVAADLVPAERRGEGMGYFGLSSTLAMALAPMIGIGLMNAYGYGVLFAVSLVLAVLSLGLSQLVRYQQYAPAQSPGGGAKTSFWAGLIERSALFPSLLSLLFAITYGGVVSFITLFGREAGIENVGWFFLANATIMLVTRPLSGILFDRKGPHAVLLPGAFFTMAGLILLSFAHSGWMLVVAALFFGTGFGLIQPSAQAWSIQRAAPERRGAANGTLFSAFDLGISVGAMALGFVAKGTSYAEMYRWSLVVMGVYLAVYLWYLFAGGKKKS
jgi:MFS family permease